MLVTLRQNETLLAEAAVTARALEERASRAEAAQVDSESAFNLAKHCLDQSEQNLRRTMDHLVSSQERLVSTEQTLAHTQNHVVQIQQLNEQLLMRFDAVLSRNQELERGQATVQQVQEAFSLTQEAWTADRGRLAETQDRIARLQELTIERDDQFRLALDREQNLWLETVDLRKRLERIESHAVLGAALRGRRQIKQIWLKFRHLSPSGAERTTRIDRPL